MLPCINKESLKLFCGTADERYQFSPDYFRKTHFPQILHRYHQNQLAAEVTEYELFNELIETDSNGNRIYFIFGSTGSGKSELLCWIKDQWITGGAMDRPVIRISRSELNPQVLIKKCYETLDIVPDIKIDENRWEILLKKPITIINQMVWATLAECLQSDEEIVPSALLLRPIIERNVTAFTKQIHRGKVKNPLEVISVEQFNELIANTTMDLPLDFPTLKQSLVHKLDQFLFEGKDIGTLFKQLSITIKERNIRPLLLIDDLVQSVNIYATELLDQLITLEEGNWDVVIGLTPGSFQDSLEGLELTQRIQNLDTIDDRVKKLWLSDESGKTFYNLGKEHVVFYMSRYLKELKASQGFSCSKKCPHFEDCTGIVPYQGENKNQISEESIQLLPFNGPMVKRVYDGIPIGKGKLRYMILNSKEIIRFLQKGKSSNIQQIHPLIAREKFAEHSDVLLKSLAEWYSEADGASITLPRMLLKQFNCNIGDISISLHDLNDHEHMFSSPIDVFEDKLQVSKDYVVRDWVEGKNVNVELLEPVRLGVACVIHDVVKATNLSRQFTPRQTAMIQRKEVENRSRYPITLSSNVQKEGTIKVQRSYPVLEVANIQQLKPMDRARKFQKISNHLDTALWVYQAEELQHGWKKELAGELGIPLHVLAWQLKKWVFKWSELKDISWSENIRSPFTQEFINVCEQVFQDWYLLRDNMVDPFPKVQNEMFDFEDWLVSFQAKKNLEQYSIGTISVNTFLKGLQNDFLTYRQKFQLEFGKAIAEKEKFIMFLEATQQPSHQHCLNFLRELTVKTEYLFEDFKNFCELESSLEETGINQRFTKAQRLRETVQLLVEEFVQLDQKVMSFFEEIIEGPTEKLINVNISWIMLEDEHMRWTRMRDCWVKLHQYLVTTPRMIVNQIINSNLANPNVERVKELWNKIWDNVQKIRKEQEVDNDFIHLLQGWENIDFHQIRNEVNEWQKRSSEISAIINKINQDLGSLASEHVHDVLEKIRNENQLRPAIRRQLIQLLEHGHSTLPPIQWRKLINEFSERFPAVFETIEVRMVIKKSNG